MRWRNNAHSGRKESTTMAKTDIETLRNADWDSVENEVILKIRLLKATCQQLESNELSDQIAEDILLPALRLLGEFCVRVTIEEDPHIGSLDDSPVIRKGTDAELLRKVRDLFVEGHPRQNATRQTYYGAFLSEIADRLESASKTAITFM